MKMINNENRIKELESFLKESKVQFEALERTEGTNEEKINLLKEMKSADQELQALVELKRAVKEAEELGFRVKEFKLTVKEGYYIHEKVFFLINSKGLTFYQLENTEEILEKFSENVDFQIREGQLTHVKNGLVFDDTFLFLVFNGNVEIYMLQKVNEED